MQALLKKVLPLPLDTICPLHGPVLRGDLTPYTGLYDTWSRYGVETEGVFVAYASIHGGTAAAALKMADILRAKGCPKVAVADLSRDDQAEAVEDAFRYGKVILAASSYDAGVFPPMDIFLHHLRDKAWQKRRVGLIENGSWAPSAGRVMREQLSAMKDYMIQIYCKNCNTTKKFIEGTSLLHMLNEFEFERPFPIVSARVNNVSQGLKFRAYQNRDIEYLDVRSASGMRVYCRSLCFLLSKSASDIFPGCRVYMEHPISNGFFCHLRKADEGELTVEDVVRLKNRMQEIVAKNIPFHRYDVQSEKAIKAFQKSGYDDKVKLLKSLGEPYTDYYTLGDTADYYYGKLVPSAGYLTVWDIQLYHSGLLLRVPDLHNPAVLAPFVDQPKTFEMFKEALRWNIIMRLATVGDVNEACANGRASELIQVAEALQEKKIVQIAEEINRRYHSETPTRVVLITGPSSSGKTTFCNRLSVQLKACGLRPLSISTDDYFVNRADTPRFPDGSFDFDNFDTVDHALMESDIMKILSGEEVSVPEYNFVTGLREYKGKVIGLRPGSILLIEGIHALNPALTLNIPGEEKFRIFINTLTSTSLDNHNWIPTSDNRLLRRIVRDYKKGAFTARESIAQWPNVCAAEEKWIYPFQETADMMFNSAYLLEFAVMRNHAEPILAGIPKNTPEYSEAHRLLTFIHYFSPVSDKEIPSTSLMREFL